MVVVLCILSSCSTGDLGGWPTLGAPVPLDASDKCVPNANDSAARTISKTCGEQRRRRINIQLEHFQIELEF